MARRLRYTIGTCAEYFENDIGLYAIYCSSIDRPVIALSSSYGIIGVDKKSRSLLPAFWIIVKNKKFRIRGLNPAHQSESLIS